MRWSWLCLVFGTAAGCGPDIGAVDQVSSSSGTGVDSAASSGTTTGNRTTGVSTDPGGTTTSPTGSSESTGTGGSTPEPPGSCERDETPLGPGTIEWSEIEPGAHAISGLALTFEGVTAVGRSWENEAAASIERFQLDGLPYWSRTWQAQGAVNNSGVAAVALPNGVVVAGVTAWRPNGKSEQWLVAYGPFGDIEWEVSLDVGWRWAADVSPSGTIIVVSTLDTPQTTVALVELDADGIELDRSEYARDDDVAVRDVALGHDGEIIAVGDTSVTDGFGAWIARWDSAHTLEWWRDAPPQPAVALAADGDIIMVSASIAWGSLHRLAPDGSQRWHVDIESPVEVSTDCAGRILVGTTAHLLAFDADGSLVSKIDLDGGARQVEADPAGDLFIAGAVTLQGWLGVTRVSGT